MRRAWRSFRVSVLGCQRGDLAERSDRHGGLPRNYRSFSGLTDGMDGASASIYRTEAVEKRRVIPLFRKAAAHGSCRLLSLPARHPLLMHAPPALLERWRRFRTLPAPDGVGRHTILSFGKREAGGAHIPWRWREIPMWGKSTVLNR